MTAAGAETTAMRTPLQLWEREDEFVVLGLGRPDDLSRLPPSDLLGHRSQNQFLYLHRPLRCRPRVGLQASPPGW
jgi:hypothetical protein